MGLSRNFISQAFRELEAGSEHGVRRQRGSRPVSGQQLLGFGGCGGPKSRSRRKSRSVCACRADQCD
jgi:hypothetical protein